MYLCLILLYYYYYDLKEIASWLYFVCLIWHYIQGKTTVKPTHFDFGFNLLIDIYFKYQKKISILLSFLDSSDGHVAMAFFVALCPISVTQIPYCLSHYLSLPPSPTNFLFISLSLSLSLSLSPPFSLPQNLPPLVTSFPIYHLVHFSNLLTMVEPKGRNQGQLAPWPLLKYFKCTTIMNLLNALPFLMQKNKLEEKSFLTPLKKGKMASLPSAEKENTK